jgi:hypothetical protein
MIATRVIGVERSGVLRTTYLLVAALVSLVLLCDGVPAIVETVTTWYPPDLVVDHRTARAYKDGYSPYTAEGARRAHLAELGPSGTGHPPTTAFWLLPVADADLKVANATVCWVSLFLLLLELVLLAGALGWPAPNATAWLTFSYLVASPLVLHHARSGQLSQPIAFCYVAAWLALRRNEQVAAGAALGVACTMKFFPAVMVLLLALARCWRAVAAAGAVFLGVAAVMTARFGIASWPLFLAQQRAVADQWVSHISNISVHGVVARLFWPACGRPGPVVGVATAISAVISLGLLGVAVWWSRPVVRRKGGVDIAFATFATLSVLIGQWAWQHYQLIYVLPAAIALRELLVAWRSGARPVAIVFGGAAVALLVASWQVNETLKIVAQHAHWRGEPGAHLRLHLLELLAWVPGVLLLVTLLALLARAARAPADPP